jgi:FkbM family methyltransferase
MQALEMDAITIHGVKVAVDKTRVSPTIMKALRAGQYEGPEAHQLPAIVEPGERIVELGGGLGFISSKAAATGRAESIAVYEANPALIPLIERTHALNGVKAEVVNAVVTPTPGPATLPFYLRRDFWASSLSPEPYGYDEVVEVPTVSVAEMLRRWRPTMLIVDIEGGEEALFHDAPLTGVRKIYLELHQEVLGRAGMKRVFDALSARDFHYDQWHSSHGVVLFSHVLR